MDKGDSTNTLKTSRLTILETPHMLAGIRCVLVNAWPHSDAFPTIIVGTVLLVDMGRPRMDRGGGWLLSHLLIEDEARRCGYATEIVRFYEARLGAINAAWVSDAGEALALKYCERFGPRACWQIGRDPAVEKLVAGLMGGR